MALTKLHYGAKDYETANSEAAQFARAQFERQIERGRAAAMQVIEKVASTELDDAIVRGGALEFSEDAGNLVVEYDDDTHPIHDHAFKQLAQRANIPMKFARELQEGSDWQRELLVHNLNEIYGKVDGRFLTRAADGELRGFLSDKYKRIDSRPIIETFTKVVIEAGAVPLAGVHTDTRFSIKAVLPMIFEPIPNEVLTFGVELKHSDFGNGPLALSFFMNRVWCTNLAVLSDALRTVHIGKRLSDDIRFSEKTYRLESDMQASAIEDVAAGLLGPGKVNEMVEVIKVANEKDLTWDDAKKKLKELNKSEVAKVEESFKSDDNVMNLPKGDNLWRLSNAVSWLAVNTDGERKLDLESVAGKLLAA